MKELLEAGVHFGHQTRRWNPKMKEYIFGERNGIHIIDLQKTLKMFREASRFVSEISAQGNAFFLSAPSGRRRKRWPKRRSAAACLRESPLAGRHADQLGDAAEIDQAPEAAEGHDRRRPHGELSKKEAARLDREMKHLHQNLAGIENMTTLPDAMFVIDSNAEEIAVKEARRMGMPVVAVVDTNCDPDVVDWIIPGQR